MYELDVVVLIMYGIVTLLAIFLLLFCFFDAKSTKQTSELYDIAYNNTSQDVTIWNFAPSSTQYGGISAGASAASEQVSSLRTGQSDSWSQAKMPGWVWGLIAIISIFGILYLIVRWMKNRKASGGGIFARLLPSHATRSNEEML
jgi:uncharacterized membrane protein